MNTIERERVVQLTDVIGSDKALLGYILKTYLQLYKNNTLNSKGEFYQTYDEIRNGMMTGISDNALRAQLKRLTKAGYITYAYKGIEGDKLYRKAIHINVTLKCIEVIIDK